MGTEAKRREAVLWRVVPLETRKALGTGFERANSILDPQSRMAVAAW
jgi:hypothetical protein